MELQNLGKINNLIVIDCFDGNQIAMQAAGGTLAELSTANQVYKDRQLIYETDTGKIKFGNGTDNYNDLDYFSADTLTSLSFNSTTNILSYSDENGNDTDIDLSLYIDDTNLARLVSGTVAPSGIATFTRDDSTTFDVDFSQFFDDSNLSRVVSANINGSNILTFTRDDSSTFTVNLSQLDDSAGVAANAAALIAHIADPDPHPQYTTTAEAAAAAPVQSVNGSTGAVVINTSLTLTGNTLVYDQAQGTTQNIDLSPYIDDTNEARIISGALSGNDLILTRDDSSTITIDLSTLSPDLSNYYTKTELDGGQLDNRYFTETEVNASQAAQDTNISNNASSIAANTTNINNNDSDITNLENEQVVQNGLIAINTAKVSFPEAPNDGQQYARQNEAWSVVAGGSSQWDTNTNGIDYDGGNVGVDTDNPIHNIQVGEQFNDIPGPARVQSTEIAQYAGTATNNGSAQLGLYESVPSAFPGDYGARIRYNATTNLLIFATVQAGTETTAFTFDRATQVAQYFADINMSTNQIKNLGNATDPQDAVTLNQIRLLNDAVKVTNTAIANVNTGVATFNNFTTTDLLGSTLGQFTFATNGITPNFTGKVDIVFNAFLTSTSPRVNPGFRWSHNGNVGPFVAHSYIRDAQGHLESSANFSTTILVVAGQPIQIQHDNLASGGNVAIPANGLEFIIKRRP